MKRTLAILALAFGVQAAAAQQGDSRAIIAGHELAIEESGERLSGPGWDRLLSEAAEAQFFMVGEQHATADIARFATRLQAGLARNGYTHAAMEIGPWSLDFAERLIRSGRGRLADYIRQPGHAFTLPFLFFQEEIDLAEQVVALSPDGEHALWGVDQEFVGAGPIALERLRGWAATETERQAATAFGELVAANPMLIGFLTEAQLDPLAAAFAGNEPARLLIEELRRSSIIYSAFTQRSGPIYTANLARETQMKRNFLRHFEEAERRLGAPPRVFLKFGGNHAMRGFSDTDVPGFADFLSEWGLSRDFRLVNLMIDCAGGQALNPQTNQAGPCEPQLGPDTTIGSMPRTERMTLIDLRALRVELSRLRDIDPASRRMILAFDYYLVIRDVAAATPVAASPLAEATP